MGAGVRLIQSDDGTLSLPVRWLQHKPEGGLDLLVGAYGYVEARYEWGLMRHEVVRQIREDIVDHFDALITPPGYYWRGTNNPDEIALLRAGRLGRSTNHADGTSEAGLSVADHLGYVVMAGYRYGYRLRGRVIGRGSDGEPLLDIASLDPVDDRPRTAAAIEAKEGKARRALLRRVLATAGWSEEEYSAAMRAILVPADEYDAMYAAPAR